MAASSQTLEERFEQLLKLNTKEDAQLDYLRKQLEQTMGKNRREVQSSRSSSESEAPREEAEEEASDFSLEERRHRRSRRSKQPSMDFKVEISKFEGQLNPNDFLDWLSTIERVFSTATFLKTKR